MTTTTAPSGTRSTPTSGAASNAGNEERKITFCVEKKVLPFFWWWGGDSTSEIGADFSPLAGCARPRKNTAPHASGEKKGGRRRQSLFPK